MGIIKGSEHALTCPEGILDRPNYLCLPHRSNPNFANQRGILYDIFETYSKIKRQRRHHDVADRTHAILKVLRNQRVPGQQIDYLYVDEAQDNLLIDALFLRQLCRNPDGLFWAGDTAQTISAGSSFRFDDLKAFLYRVEQQQNTLVTSAGAYLNQPTMFQLAINYRSHGGIVNCAHSVIELITRFWPNTIDNLRPEKGVVDGLKPVFFTGWDKDTVRYEQFLFGASGSHIEFGAQQCILVRDDAARQKLREQVGEIGLIMTLYESKGLEFNDVLLYNFFEDSVIDLSRWRIVLNGVEGQEHAPNFDRDEARYAGVCSELKLLYVGITRARKNMWIVDKSDKSDPMRVFWTSRNQIQNCTPGTDVPHLAVSSTPEEWASFGRSLFSHKRYSQAIHCFERANLHREVKVCEAYRLREVARSSVGVALLSNQKRAFNVAADAFTDCGEAATGNQKLQYYRNSADCYVRAGDDFKAAEAYLNAQEFEQAAKRYRKAGRFDKTLHVLDDHNVNIPEETKEDLWTVCRLYYCSRNNTQAPLPLFSTFQEELAFLEEYDLDYARASLLESHSMYFEAAELHLSENRPLEAARAFIKDNNVDSTIRAADTILEYFWRKCSFRIAAKIALADEQMRHFIALADQLETNKLTSATRDLISMFRNILHGNHDPLRNLALNFHEHNKPAALLCLDHIFSPPTDIRTFAVDEMQRFLQQFHAYARLLYLILTFPDPMEHRGIQRLFSIVRLSGDEFLIPSGTFLHSCVMEIRRGITLVSEHSSGYTSSRRNITQLLQESIGTVLKDKVSEINDMCCKSPVFSQCLPFLVSGVCRRDNCPQEHVAISNLDRLYYNSRVAIHIWQILILQFMYSAHPYMERRDSMRDWLNHLYEALNPPFFIQGSPADLDMSLMPFRQDGMKVVKLWIRESFYSLDPFWVNSQFLTAVMRITSLSFAFDRNDASSYISRAKCIVSRPAELIRRGDNRYMLKDLLNSYRGAICSSVSSGILFLLHVLNNRLYTNLSVLCDCIEDVCSAFIIKYRMDPKYNDFPLHNVLLPCSWLLSPHKFNADKETKLVLMDGLLDEMARLVEALRTEAGMEFLWLNHTKFTPILRNVFISRICRVICLLAHNIRNRPMRDKVNKIMLSLHKNNPPSHWRTANYRKLVDDVVKYITPLPGRMPPSDGYLRALLAFDNNKGVSNLVHLVHKTMNERTRVYIIRRLVYEKIVEIPHLLSSYAVIAQSTLRVEAPAFVPRLEHSKDRPEVHYGKEMTEPQPQEFEGEEENEEDVTANTDAETRDALETLDEAVTSLAPDLDESLRSNGPSVEEEEAARKIQNAYRRYVRRRSSRAVNAEIDAIFTTCLKETQSSEWRLGYYHFLFLGPLPHLLACLERGITLTRAAKAKTKGLLNKESHEKLEELGKQRSEIAALLKNGSKLRRQLEPSSTAHRARDIEALKRGVSEVKEFMQRVPGNMWQDMQSEFQMAYKGIVAEKKVQARKEKERPTLNVEDIDDY
jgi:tetratricopeptide (TPR) repeat protein